MDGLSVGLGLGLGSGPPPQLFVKTRSDLKVRRCPHSVSAVPLKSTNMSDGRIYVGNLPVDVQERDIEDLFYKYGKIRDIELKNNRGTIPFAFVRFEDPRWVFGMVFAKSNHIPFASYLNFCDMTSSPLTASREWMEMAIPGQCPLVHTPVSV